MAESVVVLAGDALALALHGGEEYELLFTASLHNHEQILNVSSMAGLPVTLIDEGCV